MGLKRIILAICLAIVLAQTLTARTAQAQETGPLVMRTEFEWALVGTIFGSAVGALIWLTDPAAPGNNFSDSLAQGAAWGTILGAGFGIFILQRAAIIPPPRVTHNPLNPMERITSDPVATFSGEGSIMAQRDAALPMPGEIRLPLLSLHF